MPSVVQPGALGLKWGVVGGSTGPRGPGLIRPEAHGLGSRGRIGGEGGAAAGEGDSGRWIGETERRVSRAAAGAGLGDDMGSCWVLMEVSLNLFMILLRMYACMHERDRLCVFVVVCIAVRMHACYTWHARLVCVCSMSA